MRNVSVIMGFVLLLIAASCGRSGNHPLRNSLVEQPSAASVQQALIGASLAELKELPIPSGVDPGLFAQLSSELERQLSLKASGKSASTPPTGQANAVPDLALTDMGSSNFELAWHYYNSGDYNQDGTVSVADITPLAIHYGESYQATDVNSLLAVIDGSGNHVIDIADVTPIAINIGVQVGGYAIQSSTSEDSVYTNVTTLNLSSGLDAATQRTHFSNIFTPDLGFWYRVVPLDNASMEGEPSNAVQAGLPGEAPSAPYGLSATTISPFQVDLTWQDNSDNEDAFSVERKLGITGAWAVIGGTPADITAYSDSAADPAETYYYRVRAMNSYGYSAYSSPANATTLDAIPYAPTGLAATTASWTQINLTWVDNSDNEDGFRLERKIGDAGEWLTLAQPPADAQSYSDNNLDPLTTYHYRICSFNSLGESAFTDEASATTIDHPPAAPASLVAKAISSAQIDLEWVDNADNEEGFSIERKNILGAWVVIGTVPADSKIYYNYGLTPDISYTYRICAYNSSGFSAYTNEASATTITSQRSWVHTWGQEGIEDVGGIAVSADGSIFVAGSIAYFIDEDDKDGHCDIVLLKYSPDGNLAWVKRWYYGGHAWINSIAIDQAGDLHLVGELNYYPYQASDVLYLKCNQEGGFIWQRIWNIELSEIHFKESYAEEIAIDSSGNAYILGDTETLDGGYFRTLLLKYSPSGLLVWQLSYGADGMDYFPSHLAVDSDGNPCFSGWNLSIDERFSFVVKASAVGDVLWQKGWSQGSSYPSLGVDSKNNVYIYGPRETTDPDSIGPLLVKLDPLGELAWSTLIQTESPSSLQVGYLDDEDSIYLSGSIQDIDNHWPNALLLKYTLTGALTWQEAWRGESYSDSSMLITTTNEGLLVAGSAENAYGNYYDPSASVTNITTTGILTSDIASEYLNGHEDAVNGVEVSTDGVIDAGGGGCDVFLMRADPTNW